MKRKGSITVFLALILSLMLSLVCAAIESCRMAAARTQILNSVDIGLYSLFGQYSKTLFQQYDLFAIDASGSDGTQNLASVYKNFASYMKPVLRQNSQKLKLEQGGISGYSVLTDNNGELFYQQAVQYMKDTLGSQGIQILLENIQEKKDKTAQAQAIGQQAEREDALGSYDSEINRAAQESQAAQEQREQEGVNGSEGFADGTVPGDVENPIPIIRRIRKMGLLDLVIPSGKSVSRAWVSKSSLVSGRRLAEGMALSGGGTEENAYTSGLLFQQYLMERLGNFANPGKGELQYETEYVIAGKDSDIGNLRSVATKLLLIREGVNFTSLLGDGAKRAQVRALSLAIAAGFLIPPAAMIIEGALLLCWSFAESILDVRELFDGGKVPLVKTAGDWQLSLENLPRLLEGLDSVRRGSTKGMSYEDYLQMLLLTQGKSSKVLRTMDMMEKNLQKKKEAFRMDSCIVALEASVDVQANKRKTFTVSRQYRYD